MKIIKDLQRLRPVQHALADGTKFKLTLICG